MTRWYPLEEVDSTLFSSAQQILRYPIRLPVAPARVWESLSSDASVSAWGPFVRKVVWTTPRPFGVGTTREVTLPLGSVTVREKFFRWDESRGYSFYATSANRPGLRRFAEDYLLEPDGDGTLFTWTVAIDPQPRLERVFPLTKPLNRLAFGSLVAGAKRHFAQQPPG
ncbi:SRPBCC family protein [uncultured Jatrophihabitans sp.]|uniref:SRPBCC family protein n=1 Tax=uncultured Jatrophihabitans sp. TaxID=1610747 RepID=UPI0035CB034B